MSKTILIGYEIKIGTFTSDKTGEVLAYDNRVLRFVTDSGAKEDNVGFSQFKVKLKLADLAKYLGVAANDNLVNDVLKNNLHHEFELAWAPINDSMECVGLRPKKSS